MAAIITSIRAMVGAVVDSIERIGGMRVAAGVGGGEGEGALVKVIGAVGRLAELMGQREAGGATAGVAEVGITAGAAMIRGTSRWGNFIIGADPGMQWV